MEPTRWFQSDGRAFRNMALDEFRVSIDGKDRAIEPARVVESPEQITL